MLSSSALANSFLFMYSRTTPMRSAVEALRRVRSSAYGCAGVRPTLNAVSSSFGS